MNDPTPTAPVPIEEYGGREISGRWLILGMFGFAVAVVSTLYLYWSFHRGPFLELQQAIAAEWPDCRPLVEGGQRKIHRDTPRILRVVMEVPFNPNDEDRRDSTDLIVDRLLELADAHHGLETYELFEVILFLQEREKELHEHEITVDLESRERTHVNSPT